MGTQPENHIENNEEICPGKSHQRDEFYFAYVPREVQVKGRSLVLQE